MALQMTPAIKAVIDTWRVPTGLYESDENAKLIMAEAGKLSIISHDALTKIAYDLDKRLTWAPNFAPSEQRATLSAWFQQNRSVLQNQTNVNIIGTHIQQFFGNNYTLENLNLTYQAVASQLEQKTVAQLRAEAEQRQRNFETKEKQRIERERLENSKPYDQTALAQKAREEQAAKTEAKEQEQAQREIDAFLENYTINGRVPNTTDYALTQSAREAWRKIKIQRNGKYDAKYTLAVVRRAITLLNTDYPNADQIKEAAQKALKALEEARNAKPDKGAIR